MSILGLGIGWELILENPPDTQETIDIINQISTQQFTGKKRGSPSYVTENSASENRFPLP